MVCFLPRLRSTKNGFLQRLSMWFSWQEAESHRQSLQEAIYQAQQSRQVARDGGGGGGGGGGERGGGEAKYDAQSLQEGKLSRLVYTLCSRGWVGRGEPNMTHSLCRKEGKLSRLVYTLCSKRITFCWCGKK